MNLFEEAIKGKYRFNYKGVITIEDLYDLSLKDLDNIYKDLNKQFKKTDEEGLLFKKTSEDVELDNKIKLVKYIFEEKIEEQKKMKKKFEDKEQARILDEIIYKKEQQNLENMSIEELKAMRKELGGEN